MQESSSEKPIVTPTRSIGASAAAGAKWIYGRALAVQLIHFCTIAVLARQLEARAFGVVALANMALIFINILASQGVNQYVIFDREGGYQQRAQAAFWLNTVINVFTVGIGFFLAPAVSVVFEEPLVTPILRLMLLGYLFTSMTRIFDAIRNKDLHFRTIEIRDTMIALCAAIGSISMAIAGYGVWSIVVPVVVLAPVKAITAVLSTQWRPGWSLGVEYWPRILKYSSGIIGSSITSFIIANGDTALVGRMMGSALLGVYNLAWQSSNLVSRSIVNIANKLFFPMFAAVSNDRRRMCEVLRRLLRVLSGIAFPALIGLFVLADDFVHVIYGEKWAEAVLPLRILIIYAMRYSIGSPTGPVFNALGRPGIVFKLGLITVPFYCLAIWLGGNYGIAGVAAGVTIVRTAFGAVTLKLVARQLEVSTMYLIAPIWPALTAAILMGLILMAAKILISAIWSGYSVSGFLVLIGLGVVVYVGIIRYCFKEVAIEFIDVLTMLLGKRPAFFSRLMNVDA